MSTTVLPCQFDLPDVGRMVKSAHKSPWPRPGECLEINVANVIQQIIVLTRDASNNEQLVVVEQCRMSRSAFGNGTRHGWLGPMGSLQIENYEVGEISTMLVLATKDQELVALV